LRRQASCATGAYRTAISKNNVVKNILLFGVSGLSGASTGEKTDRIPANPEPYKIPLMFFLCSLKAMFHSLLRNPQSPLKQENTTRKKIQNIAILLENKLDIYEYIFFNPGRNIWRRKIWLVQMPIYWVILGLV